MKIVSFKPDHDGSIVSLENAKLKFSIEEEKNSGLRHAVLSGWGVLGALGHLHEFPDVIAIGGWNGSNSSQFEVGYYGINNLISRDIRALGRKLNVFSSSHERSHLMCAYGLSPFEQGQPCYVLLMEGCLGGFYRIGRDLEIEKYPTLMFGPGWRYSYLYFLGSGPTLNPNEQGPDSYAGKLMALAGCAPRPILRDKDGDRAIEFLLNTEVRDFQDLVRSFRFSHQQHHSSLNPFYNIGIESPRFTSLAKQFQDEIFGRFYKFAKENLKERLPLLIAGGCALNCDWNTKWKECGLFPDVFIPPCPDDSGSAIGTAVDAQFYYTQNAKIDWSVYSGEEIEMDVDMGEITGFDTYDLNYAHVADCLRKNMVIGWIQGKYEIGPRALCNRSLLAAPFDKSIQERLNTIKKREHFRPVAPVCLEEDVENHFEWQGSSEFMLFFQRVRSKRLKAVTHVDGTARVQTVNKEQNEEIYTLLKEFKNMTGYGVLCNTSLNLKGRGFINRFSDIISFAKEKKLDGIVVGNHFFVRHKL